MLGGVSRGGHGHDRDYEVESAAVVTIAKWLKCLMLIVSSCMWQSMPVDLAPHGDQHGLEPASPTGTAPERWDPMLTRRPDMSTRIWLLVYTTKINMQTTYVLVFFLANIATAQSSLSDLPATCYHPHGLCPKHIVQVVSVCLGQCRMSLHACNL